MPGAAAEPGQASGDFGLALALALTLPFLLTVTAGSPPGHRGQPAEGGGAGPLLDR